MNIKQLTEIAQSLQNKNIINSNVQVGGVAAALISKSGKIYTGISIVAPCGMGFCAEHAAIADMLKNGETEIDMLVAVDQRGILPPCGRCRELIRQINNRNYDFTKIVISIEKTVLLKELLPLPF